MATVNMLHMHSWIQKRKTEWWWWWWFFFHSTLFCHWHAFGFLGHQQHFYFQSWQRWYFYLCIVFIVDLRTYYSLYNNNIAFNSIFFVVHFGFCYFSYRWKPTVIRNFRLVGRFNIDWNNTNTYSVYHHTMLNSYLNIGEENWWWCYS